MKTPEQMWMDYRQCIPSDCSRIQLIETKRAFASGMFVVMQFMKQLGDNTEPEDVSVAKIEQFNIEVEAMLCRIIQQDTRQETN